MNKDIREFLKDITILYVEDDDNIREGYNIALKRYSKKIYLAKNGEEGLEIYQKKAPDIVLSDINMPKMNGIDMAKSIKEINPNQTIVFTTAHVESKYTLKALEMQVEAYLVKPIVKKKLISKLAQIAKNIKIEQENRKNQILLQKILDLQPTITILTDFKHIEYASGSFFEQFNINSLKDFDETYMSILNIISQQNGYLYAKNCEKFLNTYYDTKEENRVVLVDIDNEKKSYYINIKDTGYKNYYVVTLTDITKIQEEMKKTQYLATHDQLTKIYNRAKFDEIFQIEYFRAKRYNRPLSLLLIDIDHFKKINDAYGHSIGDKFLQELSKTILPKIRQTDIFARWGGEEFVILMSETNIDNAYEAAENIRKLAKQIKVANLPPISISIGISQLNESDSVESFFERVDEALYEAKNSGRDRVVAL